MNTQRKRRNSLHSLIENEQTPSLASYNINPLLHNDVGVENGVQANFQSFPGVVSLIGSIICHVS